MLETAAKNPSALLQRRLSINREAGAVGILSNCPDVQNGKVGRATAVSGRPVLLGRNFQMWENGKGL
jgi:hypothetical protein